MSNITKEERQIMDERADQLEKIGFVLNCDANSVWYEKGDVKMIPTLMMCPPTKDWNEFIEKNSQSPAPASQSREEILKSNCLETFYEYNPVYENIKKAMSEYASQCTEGLKKENERLRELVEGVEVEIKYQNYNGYWTDDEWGFCDKEIHDTYHPDNRRIVLTPIEGKDDILSKEEMELEKVVDKIRSVSTLEAIGILLAMDKPSEGLREALEKILADIEIEHHPDNNEQSEYYNVGLNRAVSIIKKSLSNDR